MENRIRVLWICSVSNSEMRNHYHVKAGPIMQWIYKYYKHTTTNDKDYAVWDTNAIKEIEKMDGVELHVVCPKRFLTRKNVDFEMNGVFYHLFRDENSSLLPWLYFQLISKFSSRFLHNRRMIKRIIRRVDPDIIHIIGAENPQYSLAALDIPPTVPFIVQLQALLCRLVNTTTNAFEKRDFQYKGKIEEEIIEIAPFIGTNSHVFIDYIRTNIQTDATFLSLPLAMTEPVNYQDGKNQFDFVYFASNLSKAADLAIKAFAIAHKRYPKITLDIVGGFSDELKKSLDCIVKDNHLEHSVFFEGFLPTHDDVIKQIRKSKYALLPLTMDLIPSTVREAMANGLVVITSITERTPVLNSNRESVLLSPIYDYENMANDMIRVLDNPEYANTLRNNALMTAEERSPNSQIIQKWVCAYEACIDFFARDKTIPIELKA